MGLLGPSGADERQVSSRHKAGWADIEYELTIGPGCQAGRGVVVRYDLRPRNVGLRLTKGRLRFGTWTYRG